MVIIGGFILKAFRRKKLNDTFIIELPHYRLPKAKKVLLELWDKAKGFILRAGTIIVPAAIVLWFLQTFTFTFALANVDNSMLANIGKAISWIFAPLGFGNWQSSIAVISGFFAKETIVATFQIVFKSGGADINASLAGIFTPQAAYAFMAFVLLSAPCIAAIAAIKKELGTKWMFITIGFQCAVGYIVALIINQLGNLLEYNGGIFATVLIALAVVLIVFFCVRYILKSRKKTKCISCAFCPKKDKCTDEKG